MADYGALERTLTDSLQLTRRPVAVSFLDEPPEGVRRLEGAQPSGCTFWTLARVVRCSLATNSHSPGGLMRAQWTSNEVRGI